MDIFNVTATVTLNTSEYDKGIENVKNKTTSTTRSLKAQFKEMSEANKRAMSSLVNDLKSGVIGFDEYHKKISEIRSNQKALEQEMGELGISTEKFSATATTKFALIATAVVKVAQKVKELTLNMINYADRYGDLSAKYDISTQSLQEFEYIASQSGTTLDELLSTMTMMYNRAKENADVFDQLGVSVTDANGNMKSMDTLFWEVKAALDGVENSGDKSAFMLEAFGRNSMSVGEFLRKDTRELQALAQEAHDLGMVMDASVIDKAGKFNNKLDELRLRAKSAFAGLILGAEGADKEFDDLVGDLIGIVDNLLPQIEKTGEKVGKALIKGYLKAYWNYQIYQFSAMLGKGWLWGEGSWFGIGDKSNGEEPVSDTEVMPTGSYEVNERSSTMLEVKVTADGSTVVGQESAKIIAQQIAPLINQTLGDY